MKTLKQTSPNSAITKPLQSGIDRLLMKIVEALYYIGAQCNNDARLNGSYRDRTGNLKSSIGFAVVVNGKIVKLTVKGDSPEGESEGRSFLEELASREYRGIVLIVTAGMQYAKYVSAKGYNVLDSSEILAERLVRDLVRKLSKKR